MQSRNGDIDLETNKALLFFSSQNRTKKIRMWKTMRKKMVSNSGKLKRTIQFMVLPRVYIAKLSTGNGNAQMEFGLVYKWISSIPM